MERTELPIDDIIAAVGAAYGEGLRVESVFGWWYHLRGNDWRITVSLCPAPVVSFRGTLTAAAWDALDALRSVVPPPDPVAAATAGTTDREQEECQDGGSPWPP